MATPLVDVLARQVARAGSRRGLLRATFAAALALTGVRHGGGSANDGCAFCRAGETCVDGVCSAFCWNGYRPGVHAACVPGEDMCKRGIMLGGAVDLRECDLSHANLKNAYLHGAGLHYADLHSADLSGATLSFSFLTGAFLWNANLSGANLYLADLSDACLTRSDLSNAFLTFANLSGAHVWNANLTEADLREANLRGANLDDANLEGVIWKSTICPDTTNSDDNKETCCGRLLAAIPSGGCG